MTHSERLIRHSIGFIYILLFSIFLFLFVFLVYFSKYCDKIIYIIHTFLKSRLMFLTSLKFLRMIIVCTCWSFQKIVVCKTANLLRHKFNDALINLLYVMFEATEYVLTTVSTWYTFFCFLSPSLFLLISIFLSFKTL